VAIQQVGLKFLVWGGAGFAGAVLSRYLLDAGHQIYVADNLYKGMDGITPYIMDPNFHFKKLDITNEEDVKTAYKWNPDRIILLSGIVGLDACDNNKILAEAVNKTGWEYVVKHNTENVPVCAASTGSIFGKIEGMSCNEETPINPLSHYAITKYEGEKVVVENGGIALRYATAAGCSPNHRLKLLPNELCYVAYTQKLLNIFQGHVMRTFIDIRDFARSLIFFSENHYDLDKGVYCVGSEENNWSKKQLALYIGGKTGATIQYNENNIDRDFRNYYCDYSKLESTGFKCQFKLSDTIDDMLSKMSMIVEKYQIYH